MRGTFTRGIERLSYTIRRDPSTGAYQLCITHPDGSATTEAIGQVTEVFDRIAALMNRLRGEGWALDLQS